MRRKILGFCLMGTLFSNSALSIAGKSDLVIKPTGTTSCFQKISSYATWPNVALTGSVIVIFAGVAMIVVGFVPAGGNAASYTPTCGNNISTCVTPVCSTVGRCSLSDNLGQLWCADCKGNGNGPIAIAPSFYSGTSWGIPVTVIGFVLTFAGIVSATALSVYRCGCCGCDSYA